MRSRIEDDGYGSMDQKIKLFAKGSSIAKRYSAKMDNYHSFSNLIWMTLVPLFTLYDRL